MNQLIRIALLLLLPWALAAQSLAPFIQHLTVAIHGCDGKLAPNGLGFIVGEHSSPGPARVRTIYILTAAHVVGLTGDDVHIKLFKDGAWRKHLLFGKPIPEIKFLKCSVTARAMDSPDTTFRNEDYALVACDLPPSFRRSISYAVLGSENELRTRTPLLLSANDSPLTKSSEDGVSENGCHWPKEDPLLFPSYFSFDKSNSTKQMSRATRNATLKFFNPLGMEGASGGPLVTERSQLVGMVYEARGRNRSDVRAFAWSTLQSWLYTIQAPNFDPKWISVRHQNPSGAELRRLNLEIAAEAESLYLPGFRWLSVAPDFRVSTALPGAPPIRLAFDFVSSQGTSAGGTETVKVTIPSVTGEVHLGSILSQMRRRAVLGGIYLAGGVASTSLQRTLIGLPATNIQALTGVFDVGWRYRFPGRVWGIHASYREGVLSEGSIPSSAQVYPRFRAASLGMFFVFK